MHGNLINEIYISYSKLNWPFYNAKLYEDELFSSSGINSEINFPHMPSSIFINICSWYDNDNIFNHLFPSVLINCIENDFVESEVSLCLMEKLEPSFFKFGDCGYFYEMSFFNTQQRCILEEFINDFKKNNGLHNITCEKTSEAISWLKKRDSLINEIRCIFYTEDCLSYQEIADPSDVDGKNFVNY